MYRLHSLAQQWRMCCHRCQMCWLCRYPTRFQSQRSMPTRPRSLGWSSCGCGPGGWSSCCDSWAALSEAHAFVCGIKECSQKLSRVWLLVARALKGGRGGD